MKILYISYDGMTDSLGQSQVLPYLRELSKNGCEFHIVSLEKKTKYQQNKKSIQALCDEANIKWMPLEYQDSVPVLSAYSNYKKLKEKSFSIEKEVNFDIVHCRSDIPGIIGHRLQQQRGLKFLFDMRGFWADERIEGGIWNNSNPVFAFLYRYFKKKETLLFTEADAIISLTEKGKEIIQNMPVLSKRNLDIVVIPCCVDLEAFDSEKIDTDKQTQLRRELSLTNEITVFGYLGSIGTWYMLDEMLLFYSIQRKKIKKSVFLFVSGEEKENILQKSKKYNIPEEEIIVKSTSHSSVPLHISLFDYSMFFIRPTFSKSASSPTKQGELMAMKVPIICNAGVGDTDKIITRYKSGSVLADLTKETLQQYSLSNMEFDPKKSRVGAEEWYSLDKGAKSYFDVYKRMLS